MIELVQHSLSFAVRVEDAFTDTPVLEELDISVSPLANPVANRDHSGARQSDGTYRFIDLEPDAYGVTIRSPNGFTWDPATFVAVPVPDRRIPIRIKLFPSPSASPPLGTTAIRGKLVTAADQEVQIEPTATPALNTHTRSDATGEFLYVIAGWTKLDPLTQLLELAATVPGHTVTSVDVFDGVSTTNYSGSTFSVPPGRDTRARFHLL